MPAVINVRIIPIIESVFASILLKGTSDPICLLTKKPRFFAGSFGDFGELSGVLFITEFGETFGVLLIADSGVTAETVHALGGLPFKGGETPSHRCWIRYSQEPS